MTKINKFINLGGENFGVILARLEDIVTVSDEEVLEAMVILHDEFEMVVEPSGAVTLAAILKEGFVRKEGIDRIGIILSGGNVDAESLPYKM